MDGKDFELTEVAKAEAHLHDLTEALSAMRNLRNRLSKVDVAWEEADALEDQLLSGIGRCWVWLRAQE